MDTKDNRSISMDLKDIHKNYDDSTILENQNFNKFIV